MTGGVKAALAAPIAALASVNGCWAADPIAGKAIFERIRHAAPPYARRIGVAADH
jgi:hypothetical protein